MALREEIGRHGVSPSFAQARERHAAAALADNMVVCFGRKSPREALSDVWLLSRGNWREISGGPRPRWSHTLTPVGDSYVLVGGRDQHGFVPDTWVLSATYSWSRLDDSRIEVFAHAAVQTESDSVLVLGGVQGETMGVERAKLGGRLAPSAVSIDEDKLLIVGGISRGDEDGIAIFRRRDHFQQAFKLAPFTSRRETVLPVHAAAVRLRSDLFLILGGGVPSFAFPPIFSTTFGIWLGPISDEGWMPCEGPGWRLVQDLST